MRILIVEDDLPIGDMLRDTLAEEGHEVELATDGATGDRLAANDEFDAVVLDWNLPQMSGLEICARLREADVETPVLMLTARDDPADAVRGLDVGADDYMVKPFHIDVLLAKLRSLVRRVGTQRSARYRAGAIEVDVRARRAYVAGRPCALTTREYQLLEFLVRNAGIALERERIETHVWGAAFEEPSNALDVFVGRLRRKLGELGRAIETVRGVGYRLSA